MLYNYLTIALRSLWRRTFTTALTIGGLVLGMTVCLFLAEFIAFHWGFDGFHPLGKRVYRFVTVANNNSHDYTSPRLMFAQNECSSIETIAFINQGAEGIVSYHGEQSAPAAAPKIVLKEENVMMTNSSFFAMFSVPILAGGEELNQPNTVLLSESAARKYFGCTPANYTAAVGKTLTMANQFGGLPYRVTGVYREMPLQSNFQATMLFSLETLKQAAAASGNSWARLAPDNGNSFLTAYILLREGVSASVAEAELNALAPKLLPKESARFVLQPLQSIHLGQGLNDALPNDGALKLIVAAGSIALLVLMLAWINYVNLSTAFGLSRAREIGVRKAIGAKRSQLIAQHLWECVLLSSFAVLCSFAIAELLQSSVNRIVGVQLSVGMLRTGWVWLVAALILVVGTAAAGGYVGFVLTNINASEILRGSFLRSARGTRLQKILVVVQFAASVVLIVGTLVIFQQLDFMRRRDLGMSLERLLVVEGAELLDDEASGGADLAERAITFKEEVRRLPFVEAVAGSQNVPGQGYNFAATGFTRSGGGQEDEKQRYRMLLTDEQYFSVYGMKFAAGQSFVQRDHLGGFKFRAIVVNEAAAVQLGFQTADQAVGQTIRWSDPTKPNDVGQTMCIAGVVRNYHHKSLQTMIEPIIFVPSDATKYYTLRMKTISDEASMQANIAQVEVLYKRLLPSNMFNWRFADVIFRKQYEDDERIGAVFSLFAGAAVVIACLGLLGLTAFTVQQRTKEIGVRKVLGASVASIIRLLTKDFLKLVVVAIVLAVPFAHSLMQRWLEHFAYKIELSAWVFVVSGIAVAAVAFLVVAGQAFRAVRSNPVEALRSE